MGAALLSLLLVAACGGGPRAAPQPSLPYVEFTGGTASPDPDAGPPLPRYALTLAARVGPLTRDLEGIVAVPGREGVLGWSLVVSPELTYDQATAYCGGLLAFRAAAWRVPTVAELRRAPLGRYPFERPDRLWTATAPPGHADRRWAMDPATGRLASRDPERREHLRVLCVAGEGP